MITTLILCFSPLYRDNIEEFCYLARTSQTIEQYCDETAKNPNYALNLCQEFRHTTWEKKRLK